MGMRKQETTLGTFLFDDVRDAKLGGSFEKLGAHQRGDIDMLLSFISPQSTVIDIGAHVGTFAVPLAKHTKRVYAIEPLAENHALLKQNLELNGVRNVIPLKYAISSKSGTLSAHTNKNLGGTMFLPEQSGEVVETKPLDTLIPSGEKVDLIKIDVEGMEVEVLKGAEKVIRASRPIIFLEVNTRGLALQGSSRLSLERELRKLGYRFFINARSRDIGGTSYAIARIFTLYQRTFFDCLAIPVERPTLPHIKALPFALRQIKRKMGFHTLPW